MENEKRLDHIAAVMTVLNLTAILYYCLICTVTTYRLCNSYGAYDFLSSVRLLPRYPWQMPMQAISCYLVLSLLIYGKNRWKIESLGNRVLVCIAEIVLCVGVIASLDFYYSGIALLVLADLVRYIQRNHIRQWFMAILIFLFAFSKFEIMSWIWSDVPFTAYLGYYTQSAQGFFTGVESVLVSLNILLFVYYMILLFTGERAEKERIRKLNQQLNDANVQLKDYAIKLERMTEIRERNRLAREIHDTLGHTLTGIIMGADAALALFPSAPEESRKRVQVVAQVAREGLTDVRRSIKALRPDALEQYSLAEGLEKLIDNFRLTTGVEVNYEPLAGNMIFAPDEDDTIYRIIQESMTNAVRHGHASIIEIQLTKQTELLTVDIRDNGLGCEEIAEGFGLRHMKERLALLGGTMTCRNRWEIPRDGHRGFSVTAVIPIRKKEEA